MTSEPDVPVTLVKPDGGACRLYWRSGMRGHSPSTMGSVVHRADAPCGGDGWPTVRRCVYAREEVLVVRPGGRVVTITAGLGDGVGPIAVADEEELLANVNTALNGSRSASSRDDFRTRLCFGGRRRRGEQFSAVLTFARSCSSTAPAAEPSPSPAGSGDGVGPTAVAGEEQLLANVNTALNGLRSASSRDDFGTRRPRVPGEARWRSLTTLSPLIP